jgi:hypothetical protein
MRVVILLMTLVACGNDPPTYSHDYPDESMNETCVLCHSCATDGVITETAPSPTREHPVCEDCHATDPVTHNCDVSCDWQKSCDDPPYANCSQCHAAGVPQKTITEINDACRRCHQKAAP